MIRRNFIMHYSLFAAMVGALAGGDACAAVRIGNTTRANYYNQQLMEQQRAAQQQQVASVNDISRMAGTNTNVNASESTVDTDSAVDEKLEACSAIYPNGEFAIDNPTAGLGMGGGKTCVAVVEMRGLQMGQNGADLVLARANVAAGSTIKCNISDFPTASYTLNAQNVLFPADNEPTIQDVKKVMNQEQKQNAGLKIAAATLVGALGGNISGKNDVGNDSLMGTDKNKKQNTLIGALGGAAIGVGGTYGGKVAGDMIMSASVNAAAGGIVGNIMAAGDSVLRIEKCDGTTCLWGYLVPGKELTQQEDALCADKECYNYYINLNNVSTVMRCEADNTKCTQFNNLVSIKVLDENANILGDKSKDKSVALEDLESRHLEILRNRNDVFHLADAENGTKKMVSGSVSDAHTYGKIVSAKVSQGAGKAVVIKDFPDSAFGKKTNDWREWKKDNESAKIFYLNTSDGSVGEEAQNATVNDFYPMYISAEDGGIVDLGNKARLKSTAIGAGAGGALGAFTAYQGAQEDIDERWVTAVREYKDSLQKFYCVTGGRFLSYYNDIVFIPDVNQ